MIEIDENDIGAKPCYIRAKGVQGGSYKRVDDKDIRLSAAEIFELQRALSPQDCDRTPVLEADLDDLDIELLDALFQAKKATKALRGTTTSGEQLARLNVTTKDGRPRLAGLLVVGAYPQQFFPSLYIDVAVHPANEKSPPGSSIRFLDQLPRPGEL